MSVFSSRKMRSTFCDLDLCPLEDFDRLALAELDDRLLPPGLLALERAAALRLRLDLDDVHALDLVLEQLLHCLAHLGLVRVGMDAERVLVVADQRVALLGDDRGEEDFVRVQAHDTLACTCGSAASLTRSERAHTSSETSSSPGTVTRTRSRFRNDFPSTSSSSVTTTSSGSSRSASSCAALRVEGSSPPSPESTASEPACAWSLSAERNAARRSLRFTFTS